MEQSAEEEAWGLVMASHELGTPYTDDQAVNGGAPPPRNVDIEAAAYRVSRRIDPEQEPELARAVEDIRSRYAEEPSVGEMAGAFEGGPDSVEWLREQRGGKDEK